MTDKDFGKLTRRQFAIPVLAAGASLLAAGTASAQDSHKSGPVVQAGLSPRLTIHVLDVYNGVPAPGLKVDFFRLADDQPEKISSVVTEAGRSPQPLLVDDSYRVGTYELLLHVGDYYAASGAKLPKPPFLTEVPIRFRITDAQVRLHLPILLGPWSYTYSRGS